MTVPTYVARNGQKGEWYIDVDEYGPRIPVLHYVLIGPNSVPWPNQFLKGDLYSQPCHGDLSEKAAQLRRIVQLNGLVCMTRDFWSDPPGTPKHEGQIKMRMQQDGYVGLFISHDARFEGRRLTFWLGDKLCNLIRPSDCRRGWK